MYKGCGAVDEDQTRTAGEAYAQRLGRLDIDQFPITGDKIDAFGKLPLIADGRGTPDAVR